MTSTKELVKILEQEEFPTTEYLNYVTRKSNEAVEAVRKKIDRKIAEGKKP
ncbi:hypothetical protein KBB48_03050 [Candidatus Shapirobacteria bacterium]|nr:hypothetical protein [Candidatus Shapirobacteria bacterium]